MGRDSGRVGLAAALARAAEATHISTYGRNPDLPTQLQRLGAHGLQAQQTSQRSEYVLVVLQKLEDLEADLSGPSGLQAGVHSPTILAVGAISTPDDLRSLASELVEKTAGLLRLVDAPLSGTPAAAARGELSIVVGATPGLYRDSLPVLELLGTCVRVGGVGSAQIANACEQYVIAATAAALSEAAVIAERAGLDLSRVLQSWELSLAGSRVLGAARGKLLNRDFEPDLPAGPRWRRWRSRLNKHGGPALQRGCLATYGNSSSCWIELDSSSQI